MKKLLSIILLTIGMIVSNNTKAISIDSIKTDINNTVTSIDTSSVTKTIYQDVKSALVGLSSGLKVGAEHVYQILVKQQIVNSITYLILLIIALLLLIPLYKFIKFCTTNNDAHEGHIFICFIAIIVIGAFNAIMLSYINKIIMGFVNPEYGAIEKILELIK